MDKDDYEPEHKAEDDDGIVGTLNPMFSNTLYNRLKFLAQVVLPGIGSLYFGLSTIWGLPAGEEVVGSIVVIDTFLGVILGVSSASYRNETEGKVIGFVNVEETDDKKTYSLEFPGNPEDIDKQDKITFKVRRV